MNLALLTHYLPTANENYQQIADLTIPGRDTYCARHGYRHWVHKGPYQDPGLYWAIQRLHLARTILFGDHLVHGITWEKSGIDILWVLNPQSIITNLSKPVTDYLTPEHDFFICADINGLNAASFIIRKSEWSKRWLDMLTEKATASSDTWFEQRQMINHYQLPEWRGKIKVLNHPSINSYLYSRLYNRPDSTPGQWHKGDLVLSFPGTTFADRLKLIPEYLAPDNITN